MEISFVQKGGILGKRCIYAHPFLVFRVKVNSVYTHSNFPCLDSLNFSKLTLKNERMKERNDILEHWEGEEREVRRE